MKFFIPFPVLWLMAPVLQCSQSDSQSWVTNLLTELSVVLKDGVPTVGIPNLDPIPISKQFSVNSSMFRGNIVVEGELSGFSNYAVGNARLDPDLYTELDVVFVSTKFQGAYLVDGAVYDGIVPLTGTGPVTIYLSFIEIALNGSIVAKDQMLQLKDFNLRLKDINVVQIKVGGLLKEYGLDEVLEPSLEGLINTAIQLFKNDVQNYVTKFIMTDGNLMLRGVSIDSLIRVFKDFSSTSAPTSKSVRANLGNAIVKMFPPSVGNGTNVIRHGPKILWQK